MMKPLAQISYEKQWFALEDCFAILEDIPFQRPTKTRVTDAWGDPGPDVYTALRGIPAWRLCRDHERDSRVPGVGQVPHGVHQETLWSQGPFFQRGGGEKFGNRTTSGPVQCEGHAEYRNSCGPYEQGGLWVEGKQEGAMPHSLELPTGASIEGSILPTENSVVKFNPKRLHKSMPWTGHEMDHHSLCQPRIFPTTRGWRTTAARLRLPRPQQGAVQSSSTTTSGGV